MPESSSSRYGQVDALRGLAALLVVWMHTSEVFHSLLPAHRPGAWVFFLAERVDVGRIGVVAFFAISGFVIPASFPHGRSWLGIWHFVLRRFFRLYPAYWLSIPLGVWSSWYLWDKTVTLPQIIANLTMLPAALGYQPVEGLYWTLQVELTFYGCCVVLYSLGWIHRTRFMALASQILFGIFALGKLCGLVALPGIFMVASEAGYTPLYLAIMFWGALFRAWYDGRVLGFLEKAALWALPLTMMVVMPGLLGAAFSSRKPMPDTWFTFLASHALGLALFLLIIPRRHFKWTFGIRLGEISYSVYLFHPVVFYPIYWWAKQTPWEPVRALPLGGWVLLCMVLTILFSAAAHRWVEQPAIALSRRLTRLPTAERA